MKKFVCGLLVGIMLTLGITTYAIPEIKEAKFSPDIALVVNGERLDTEIVSVVTTDKPGYMTNYVPARALAESLGATVTWNGKERVISVDTVQLGEKTTAQSTSEKSSVNIQLPSVIDVYGTKAVNGLETKNALKAKGYDIVVAVNREYMQIVKDDKIIVGDIPTLIGSGNKLHFPYDFYEKHILPLLQ